jgi:uncharacterized iron-regulated membrane protein
MVNETAQGRAVQGGTWRRSPQRVWLRRAIFQVHLWMGLVLTLYAVVIGLSGSALVFADEIARLQHPALFAIGVTGPRASVEQTVRRIEQERKGWKAYGLERFAEPDEATEVMLSRPGAPPTVNYRMVFFNPYSGAILEDRMHDGSFMGWVENLHVQLLSGRTGLLVSGWMGVGLLVLAGTGLVLWWPGVRRWRRSLVLSANVRWRRMNWDLHTVVGFWMSAALVVVTFTGVYLVFPDAVGKGLEVAMGGDLSARAAAQNPPMRPASHAPGPVLTLDQAIAAAYRALPENAPPGFLLFSGGSETPFRVVGYLRGAPPFSQLTRVVLDRHTGEALSLISTSQETRAMRMEQFFVPLHFGSFASPGWLGTLVKVFWVFLGLTPALLAVTGVILYWNRKLRRLWRGFAS